MARHHIPTAQFQNFRDLHAALDYLKKVGAPVVVKASGLAAGKGAVVCMTEAEALDAVNSMLGPHAIFGDAGHEIVIEEFMEGEEASVFAVCDGTRFALLPSAQDHKRVFDGDRGPNTGGMGAYSPAPIMTQALLERTARDIIQPTLDGMRSEGQPYQGILFVGLMLTPSGPKVVEFNCRFGDPETQVVLPVYTGDLLNLLLEAAKGKLPERASSPTSKHAAIVVAAAAGYPGAYRSGLDISGVEEVNALPHTHVIHAGTKQEGTLKTAGGRVLGIVGESESLAEALKIAYNGISKIQFEGMHYRHDIGQRGLALG